MKSIEGEVREVKEILIKKMENLYGGTKTEPSGINEKNEEFVLGIWNNAIKKCINIVENL